MNLIYTYVNKDLEGKTVKNTNPRELQRLCGEESDKTIEGREKRLKFSIVNSIFFTFVWFMFYISPLEFTTSIIITPFIIALIFSLLALLYWATIKDERRRKRITYSIIEFCGNKQKKV